MTETREVSTQAQLDKAIEDGVFAVITGGQYFEVSGSATVRASGSATVSASGSATVRAYGSATVSASGSATVSASGSATVRASGSATVSASAYVAVHNYGGPKITGGVVINVPHPSTAEEWCAYRGVELTEIEGKPAAILIKAVRGDYRSQRTGPGGEFVFYTPGSTPAAADWDGGTRECGGGLHFCARTWDAAEFVSDDGIRYLACPVWLADIAVRADADMPQKVKARGCCAPIWEIDEHGNRIEAA